MQADRVSELHWITKGHIETFEGDKNASVLNYGDEFTDLYIFQNSFNY